MARARMLSRSLGSSRRFNALYQLERDRHEFAQLIYALLIPHTDDYGRMAGDPSTVKLTVLPGSPAPLDDFHQALFDLHQVQLIVVYENDGDIWLQVNKFDGHQPGLTKRTESKIPAPPHNSVKFPEIREIHVSRARAELRTKNLELRTRTTN